MALNSVMVCIANPRADALIDALRQRGLRTMLMKAGEPDALCAAMRELDVSPAQCALIGDTVANVKASRMAGLTSLGLLCGGSPAEALRSAGARRTYGDVEDLLAQLEDALKLASPGSAHLTFATMESLMRPALNAARAAMENGEAPIGCALFRGDGTLIATGCNEQNRTQNKIAHAEIVTFAAAAGKAPLHARDLLMASTLEPCVMCTGAAMEAAVDTIIYGLKAPADAGSQRVACPLSPESQMPRIIGGVLAGESRQLFEEFLRSNPRPEQAAFVKQLLNR